MTDPDQLQRFVDAQDRVYGQVCVELAAGSKTSHWMWFIFPQLKGLSRSAIGQRYGIASSAQAQAYWQHPVLRARLVQCVELMLRIDGKTALEVLGSPDNLKLWSSMTLFAHAVPDEPCFGLALRKYFGGESDSETLRMLDDGAA